MKNQVLASHCKPLLLLGIFAIALSACSGSDDDTDLSNSAPSVSAGEDQTVNQGATVNLTGVASDSDGSISSWLWQQTSGSPSVTIKNSTTSNASFAAPEVDAETTLVFELEVKDNDGASVSDSMRVTVRGSGDSVNPLPDDFKAEAGDTQVTLTWSHYSSATDYNIYRSSASDCQLANYTSCANGALFTSKPSPFTDTGLTNGTTYYYWIEAILEGVTYLDNEATSAKPVDDDYIDLTNGLVAHYEFDGDASDSSGNGNDGEDYGGVSYVGGVIGQAASFDGVNDYIEMEISDLPINNEERTIAAWVMLNSGSSSTTDQTITTYGGNVNNSKFGLQYGLGNSYVFGSWLYGCSYDVTLDDKDCSQDSGLGHSGYVQENLFYHLVALHDGTTTKVFIDGELQGAKSQTIATEFSEFNVAGEGYQLHGLVDDLRIYDRALNTEEIQALYELGKTILMEEDFSNGLDSWVDDSHSFGGAVPEQSITITEEETLEIVGITGGNYYLSIYQEIYPEISYGKYILSFDWKVNVRETPHGRTGGKMDFFDSEGDLIGRMEILNSGQTYRTDIQEHRPSSLTEGQFGGHLRNAAIFDWESISVNTDELTELDFDEIHRVEVWVWVMNDAGAGGDLLVDNISLSAE